MATNGLPIDTGVRIGHVHLRVADLERSLGFYRDVLGFQVTQLYGSQAMFTRALDVDALLRAALPAGSA